ncbi:MAG: MlaD family protein [Gemmatimonadales bacterium]|jgi:phospholipid/cholesterol/gamma-HCH transport system substrate-binding protein
MRRRDEVLVGATIIASAAAITFGALWLSQSQLGRSAEIHQARFRTVGGLGVGNPVVLRGVRVGRVEAIRLAEGNWVEADIQVYEGVALPTRPAIVAASRSLFGEWQGTIVDLDQPPDDPNVRRELEEALAADSDAWPGASLPDIGELTAQANRIAGDITNLSSRVQQVFDSQAVAELQGAIRDFTGIADNINQFTQAQTEIMGEVGMNLRQGSTVLNDAARRLQNSLARVDEATEEGELETILTNTAVASRDAREALEDFRAMVGIVRANDTTLVRLIAGADSLMTRLEQGTGTLGLLVSDSTLYSEATLAVRQLRELLADIQANPRKYFQFSVF